MSQWLSGKRALVTGGESGIGKAIAVGFANEGARVCIGFHRREAMANEVVSQIRDAGGAANALQVDLSRPEEIDRFASDVWRQMGGIDVLVNNAALLIRRPFLETELSDLDRILAVDLRAPFWLSRVIAERMAKKGIRGSIIHVSSVSQERAAVGLTAYQAAKGGVFMLTRGMALELAPFGIRVNAIAPGFTLTEMNRDLWSDKDILEKRIAQVPLGRAGTPEDHAGAAILLASDRSSFITGASLTVDGGITAR